MLFGSENISNFENEFDKFVDSFSDEELLNELKKFSTNSNNKLEERLFLL